MTAILFGSISTLADTSELQRDSFNRAFAEHGLNWRWGQSEYREMLATNGGADRIADYASERGEEVDAKAIHATKSKLFQESLGTARLTTRPGVRETIAAAKAAHAKIGFVTTTSQENVGALINALPDVLPSDFDVITDISEGHPSKPDPSAYTSAVKALGEDASDCIAVEDNIGGVRSAVAAGLRCVAFPNENTTDQPFEDVGAGVARVSKLDFAQLCATGREA